MSKPRRPKSSPSTNDPFEKSKPERAVHTTPSLFDEEMTLDEEDAAALENLPLSSPEPEEPAPEATEPPVQNPLKRSAPVVEATDDSLGSEFSPSPASAESSTDEENELVPRRRNRREEAALPSVQMPAHPQLDRIGRIAALILVPLLFVGVFFTILKKRPVAEEAAAKPKPSLPIAGKLVEISEATTGWRERTEGDRVSPELQLLTRTTVYPSRLPELHLKLNPSAPNAFLRVLFMNGEGKIAGDPKIIKVLNGKIQATGATGDKVISDVECTVAASTGLQTDRHLQDYLRSDQSRWSVKISESADYQAKDDDWKLLDTFAIADNRL